MKARTTRILSLILLLLPMGMKAQDDSSYMKSFEQYREDMFKNYNDFLERVRNGERGNKMKNLMGLDRSVQA